MVINKWYWARTRDKASQLRHSGPSQQAAPGFRRCIHLAFRYLFETPSDFSGTNYDRREFRLTDLAVGKFWSCLLDGQRRAQLSALPRVEGVACS
ncbi:hypothetical protein TNCV_1078611 [Trichonephila clavipes]|nr:hypothetical protein TNCV_1078611 [Trichonephila clavipes]